MVKINYLIIPKKYARLKQKRKIYKVRPVKTLGKARKLAKKHNAFVVKAVEK